jgi:hypothetical protein
MIKAGFTLAGKGHPICPIMLSEERLASVFADKMLGQSQTHSYNSDSQQRNSDFLIINQIDAQVSQIYFGMKLYMFRTVPLSTIRSHSLYTQEWYMSYRFVDSI